MVPFCRLVVAIESSALARMVPSRFVLEFVWRGLRLNKILDQAARSTGFSANLFVRVCHPSTLRIVI
jgi:hypothetical protein